VEDLTKFTEDGHPIDIAYLDFKKAFDSLPHQRLLSKSAAYGITGNIFKWIKLNKRFSNQQTSESEGRKPLDTNDRGFKRHPPEKHFRS